jgi:hypothetical protein
MSYACTVDQTLKVSIPPAFSNKSNHWFLNALRAAMNHWKGCNNPPIDIHTEILSSLKEEVSYFGP